MGHWNYRLVRHASGELHIREVYYSARGTPNGYCDAALYGDTKKEIRDTLQWMRKALEKPVLRVTAKGKLKEE
jgi:hypothetical protein